MCYCSSLVTHAADPEQKTSSISETRQDGIMGPRSLRRTNRKSHTRFPLVPKSMTLDNKCHTFGVFQGFRNNDSHSNKKLSYRRETARQLPTWRGLSPPVHSPSPLWLHLCVRSNPKPATNVRNVKRAVRKAHFKLNRAFKVIQGYSYLCRQEPRAVYCRNVQLMPALFLKLTKIWQQEHSKFVDFNDPTQV